METKHTPGPWGHYQRDGSAHLRFISGPSPRAIAIATIESIPEKYQDAESIEANAHLIAAAPDMLEALESILDGVDCQPGYIRERGIEIARAAIAKAKGKNND